MEIQKNISGAMRKKLREYRNQEEFARELGVGRTTFQTCLAGTGNPNAETIELLAKGMGVSPAELVSGGVCSVDRAFELISAMLDTLHPSLKEAGIIQFEAMRQLFLLSEERCAKDRRWKYAVIEPQPFRFAIKAAEKTKGGWQLTPTESRIFTDDYRVAKAAAELFTRSSLSPIHLNEAIEDYVSGLKK